MKKVLFTLIAIIGLSFAANAQSNLGLRLGTGTELSWQKGINDANRLEFDLGLDGIFNNSNWNYISLSAIYQWHFNIVDQLGWYVGPGANIGFYTWKDTNYKSELGAAVGGQIGLDYVLPIPLQLSLDARPMWNITGKNNGFGWSACLGVRYMF